MALLVVAAPARNEVFGCVTNTQWLLALTLVLTVVRIAPRRTLERLSDAAVVVLAGLSGPFSIIMLPLFVARAVRERSRYAVGLLTAAASCAAIQAIHLPPSRGAATGTAGAGEVARAVASWAGLTFASWTGEPRSGQSAIAMALATVVVIAAIACVASRRRDFVQAAFLAGAMLAFAAALWAYRREPITVTAGGRYLYLPTVLLLWSLASRPGFVAAIGLACALLSSGMLLRIPDRMVDYDWAHASQCIGVERPCTIRINPPGWTMWVYP